MLELYQAEDCPHSSEVREALTELGESYVVHNPRRPDGDVCNRQAYDELTALADEDTIPLMIDHRTGEAMTDSGNIVEYLETTYGDR